MIHLVIGTKAQLIKMCPIIYLLEEKKIPYNYIDTGQHQELTRKLRKKLNLNDPDFIFTKSKNINSTIQGIAWIIKILGKSILNPKKIFKNDKKGLCIVHGDTVSTFLGAVMGKLGGQKIVHVEAGFRSSKLFKPFPEEIIRRLVDRWSKINFAFKNEGMEHLKKEKVKGKNYKIQENTLIDMVEIAKTMDSKLKLPKKFILVSIHRYETIYSRRRMKFIVNNLLKLAQKHKISWGLHEPTKNALNRYNLMKQLKQEPNIKLCPLFDYFDFIHAIDKCLFLITDGGGPQDESKYLNKPCLLMRSENEKPNYPNVCECPFEEKKIQEFLKNLHTYRNSQKTTSTKPSAQIVKILLRHINQKI